MTPERKSECGEYMHRLRESLQKYDNDVVFRDVVNLLLENLHSLSVDDFYAAVDFAFYVVREQAMNSPTDGGE